MIVQELMKALEKFCKIHNFVLSEFEEGPMCSGLAQLRGKSRRLRLVLDRGDPSLEIELKASSGPSWFDADMIQSYLNGEPDMTTHSVDEQISFMSEFLDRRLDEERPLLGRELEVWLRHRARNKFGFNVSTEAR